MRICLFGDFHSKTDEGMSKLSKVFFERLKEKNEVIAIDTKDSIRPQVVNKILKFKPDVIHYIPGPTIRSFSILKIYSLLTRKTKIISSAIRPYFSGSHKRLIYLLKPDFILTQSTRWENFFRSCGIRTGRLFNGIDCKEYIPVSSINEREMLRQKYGIKADKFVVLHIGHLKENRNLRIFLKLAKNPDIQCVITASTSTKADENLKKELVDAGIILIHDFVENIEEIYKLADCYVFCVNDKPDGELPSHYNEIGVIDTPLSVLEAMACNLPVIATVFGALPLMFQEEGGFYFYDGSYDDLSLKLSDVRQMKVVTTRKMVYEYDWERVIQDLFEIYSAER